jgi:hypothetical protein
VSSFEPGQTPEPADLLPEIRAGLKESLMTRPSHVRWLIAEVERLRGEVDELLAELDGRDEKARKRWIKRQEKELRLRSMEFREGRWEMSLEGARDMAAAYTAMAKTLLGDAPNYSETKLSFDVKVAESPELYTIVVQRHTPGALTPHEARQRAEAELDQLRALVADFTDPDSCELDHDGYCQAHGWYSGRPCPHRRAKELGLAGEEPSDG